MKKFTVFTVILTVVVIVIVAEILVDDYLPELGGAADEQIADEQSPLPKTLDLSRAIATDVLGSSGGLSNKLGADLNLDVLDVLDVSDFSDELPGLNEPVELFTYTDTSADPPAPVVADFENVNFVVPSTAISVFLREEQVRSAGFPSAYIEEEPHGGNLFKNILIDDLQGVDVQKYVIKNADSMLAKVYVFRADLNTNINEVFELLKLRSAEDINMEINANNEFGIASFYINDNSRPGTAFLNVRIAGYIYSFSYPKEYHPQMKNLIQLLSWEFS